MSDRGELEKSEYAVSLRAVATGAVALGTLVPAAPLQAMLVTDVVTPMPQEVNAYTSLAGMFDISGLLPTGTGIDDVDITAARVIAYGYSDATANDYSRQDYTSYQHSSTRPAGYYTVSYYYSGGSSWSGYYSGTWVQHYPRYATDRYYRREVNSTYRDTVRDRMGLEVGSENFNSSTEYQNPDYTTTYSGSYYRASGSFQSGYRYERRVSQERRTGWYGAVSIVESLAQSSLDDLSLDGLLGFNLTAQAGRFRVTGLGLEVDFSLTSNPSAVPVASTLSLFLFGGLFGAYRLSASGRRKIK